MNLRRQSISGLSMSDETFDRFRELTLDMTGIQLSPSMRAMVESRVGRRLHALKLEDFEAYLDLVLASDPSERTGFIDSVTNTLTYFFREPHHFAYLEDRVFPRLAESGSRARAVRIWSAGCSSGQEPYTLAMVAERADLVAHRSVRILCTDIHSKMVEQTRRGVFAPEEMRGLSSELQQQWFRQLPNGSWQADQGLRSLLICKQMNLFGPWPLRRGVDVIMCRNTLTYFDEQRRTRLIRGFAELQEPGSHLILGHAETLVDCEALYERVASTVYRRL